MRTHARLLVFLLAASSLFSIQAASYKSLANDERNEFSRTYASIKQAYKEANYSIIKQFCPDILDKYGSIMLDAKSEDLRPKFKEIQEILVDSRRLSTRDSLLSLIYEHHRFQRYGACADIYQDFFAFLDREGIYDSLKRKEMPHLYECILRMYENDQSFETFRRIDQYRYSDRAYVERIRKQIEGGFEERILRLSSEMNVDTLIAFKEKYPGVFTNDVESLLQKARDKYRLSILRKISPAVVKEFYDKFGGPDSELETTLEKSMWVKFLQEQSREDAEDYAYRFPKGKNIISVQEYLSHFAGSVASADTAKKY
jgi:hypothetical protein